MSIFRQIPVLIVFLVFAFAQTQTLVAQSTVAKSLRWYDVRDLGVEGKGWTQTKSFYDRLPSKAETMVRAPVWKLGQNSAGMSVRFVTNSDSISVRWTLRSPNLALPHMAATGVSGVDLYVKDKTVWRWLAVGRAEKSQVNEQLLINNIKPEKREYRLYLPLYNGVEAVEIGLSEKALFEKARAETSKPIVFYGTSIVQGAVASRAGMAYPSILGRRLNKPIINLGFSGNGMMEQEMAALLTEIEAAVYVVDCLPNLNPSDVFERTVRLVRTIRGQKPRTPILLIENIQYADAQFEENKRQRYQDKNKALLSVYKQLLLDNVTKLYYVKSDNLLGSDGEATVDGTHPTDLGFVRIADALEPWLKRALNER